MTALSDAFARGLADIYAYGVPATHTDKDDVETSATVLVDYDLSTYGDTAEVSQATATISVRVSELALAPRRGDTFVVGAKTFIVSLTQSSDELEHVAMVS